MKQKQNNQNWREFELGELGKIVTGGTPSRLEEDNYSAIGTPWIKPPNLDKKKWIDSSEEYLSEKGKQKARILPKGSVIVSCIGNIGKVAIANCELSTNQQINSIIPNENVDPEFLFYTIKKFQKRLENLSSNAVVPLLNKTGFSKAKIPLPILPDGTPDIEKQKQIVAILEKAEALKEKRKNLDELFDEYLKSVFYEMFLKEKGKFRFEEINESILKTENKNPQKDFPKQEFIYVDIASIDNLSKQIVETKKFLGKEAPSRARQLIRQGDILVSTVRPNLNAVALVDKYLDKQICSTGFCILRPNTNKILSRYLFFISQQEFFIKGLVKKTKGANYPAVSNKDIKSLKIPLPPIPLQEKFATIVEQVEKIKEKLKNEKQDSEELFNVLMQKAFSGELV